MGIMSNAICKFSVPVRLIWTFPAVMSKCSGREARFMNKFISGSSKRRTWHPVKEITASSLPYHILPQKGERITRRVSILNKLFMKYVSDLMSTGELSTEITRLGIEISKVKVSSDFAMLAVYWVAKGTSIDKEIESILARNAGKLKHELSQLRVVGNVPSIQFVKDKSMSKIAEVDAVLARADFGEDFEPTDPMFSLMPEFTLSTKLPPQLEKEVLDLDGGIPEEPLPVMRMDVLGLEQDVIMEKVLNSMKKAQALHRYPVKSSAEGSALVSEGENQSSCGDDLEDHLPQVDDEMVVQKSELRKFFAKRMAMQSKMYKAPKNYQPEKELLLSQPDGEGDEEVDLEDENLGDDDFEDEDFDITSGKHRRIKELEIHIDDFEEIDDIEEIKSRPVISERRVK